MNQAGWRRRQPSARLRWQLANQRQPHLSAVAAVQSERWPQTLRPKPSRASNSPALIRSLLLRTLRRKPNATWLLPLIQWQAPRQNSSAAFHHLDTVSSPASDFAIHPRKLFAAASHQTANVRLLQGQTGGDLAIGKPLLFQKQAASHWLLNLIQSPARLFNS